MTRQFALAFALLLRPAVFAPIHYSQQPPFRSDTLGVRVDVLVTDGRKPVGGLSAQDFEVRDNGVVQSIDLVDAVDVPLNIVLALDTSASTEGKRHTDLIAAGQALLDDLKPNDRVALTTFSHAVTPRMAFTTKVADVRDELLRIVPSGRTAVMDAVYVALTITLAQPGRSLVVVCTDGSDISSWLQPAEVMESAKRSNAVIYAVTSADQGRGSALEELADASGGGMLRVASTADLRGAFQRILHEFRRRYILAYTPNGVPSGGFHRLEVRVKRRGLSVKARPGYIGKEAGR
jgi:Ca-activated chloride channel family protein